MGSPERVLVLKLDVTDPRRLCPRRGRGRGPFRQDPRALQQCRVAVVGPTELATFADWDWVMSVNLGGTINGIVTILPRIKKHGEGVISSTPRPCQVRTAPRRHHLRHFQGSRRAHDGMHAR